ncbi:MAG: two-component regulator propeller domain-containing protein, partial [Bryobacteraceae bacterium]
MRLGAIAIASAGCCLCLWAELLPIRSYSTADGLPSNQVERIVVDSRGFVWFCTPEGLSRFDGYRITNFGVAEGLPGGSARGLVETRSGDYLVATARGLGEFRAGQGHTRFAVYTPGNTSAENSITALVTSSSGRIWLGTWAGVLFEMLPGSKFRRQALADPPRGRVNTAITDIMEDSCGKLWVASSVGISVSAGGGSSRRLDHTDGLPSDFVNTLFRAKDGRLWAGFRWGFAEMNDGCPAGWPSVREIYPPEPLSSTMPRTAKNVESFAEAADGSLWLGTADGLIRLMPGSGQPLQRITRAQGLTDPTTYSLASDKAGNIWVGTEGAGAMMIQPSGFTTFREQDGLKSDRIWSVFSDRAGNVVTVSVDPAKLSLNLFDGARFHALEAPQVFAAFGGHHAWGMDHILLQSRTGEWWGATAGGLCRYAAVKAEDLPNKAAEECYFRDDVIFQVFEDSKGGIWASSQSRPAGVRLMRWDPGKQSAISFPGWPVRALIKSFAEDPHGDIWMGSWDGGGLYRYDGRQFSEFGLKDGVPSGTIYALLCDSRGRLWIAADGGLGMVEDARSAPFRVRTFDRSSGLATNSIHAVLEDRAGYIYAAGGAGIDRLDPGTGHIKRFSSADGVALGQMESALRDRDGNLWFATAQGLSRLAPAASAAPIPPAVLITGLQAGGAPRPVSQRGETSISGIRLEPSRNQLQVEFVALSGEPETNLLYSYKLEGSDSDWSPPRAQHTVNFAALGAGTYRFQVKAVNSDGQESPTPAQVVFTVLPPLWRRWWFEGLAAAALASIVYLLHIYRVSQMVNLERMRTAIATDLHDDIGSSLSQIAVLSEVARAGVNGENRRTQESLQRVAVLARELVDSMGDIVWSIRAVPDGLDSLVSRMRQFAFDLLAGQGIDFHLRSPQTVEDVHLS